MGSVFCFFFLHLFLVGFQVGAVGEVVVEVEAEAVPAVVARGLFKFFAESVAFLLSSAALHPYIISWCSNAFRVPLPSMSSGSFVCLTVTSRTFDSLSPSVVT